MSPFDDAPVPETLGLDLLINKAPDKEWKKCLYTSLEANARADNVDVFHRLFALCRDDSDVWAVDMRIEKLLNHTA